MKRIVVCADGTWNRPEKNLKKDTPTNVLRVARAIKPVGADGITQQVFYDWGLGSYHDRIVAGTTGRGIEKNILDGYRYIVQNYSPGDDIFLFGFSRGAYTVRSLCGLINNCGIVKRPNARLIQMAFDHYKRSSAAYKPSSPKSAAFRRAHSHRARKVRFLGAWDTVGALGIPISFLGLLDDKDEFYDTELGSCVETARQALAVDECRLDFRPAVWVPKAGIDIQQVWFLGAHSDVGGGYRRDPDGTLLSDFPLRWMMRAARIAGLTLESFLSQRLAPNASATLHQSRRAYYRLKKKLYRDIEHGSGPVLIHRSVKQRWDADAKYQRTSKNLAAYIDTNGWPDDLVT